MLINQPFFLKGLAPDLACLFLHGLGGGAYEMRELAERLQVQGLTVQGILYPGHDRPASQMPASTWQEWYAASLEAYQELAQTYAKVDVVGFSTGCLLGLHLAAAYPVQKLVCLCPFFSIYRPAYVPVSVELLAQTIGYLLPTVPRLHFPIRNPQMQQQAKDAAFFPSFNLAAVRSALALIKIVKPELSQVTCPTLIMQTRGDRVVNPQGAQFLYDRLGGETKELQWLERSDHIITLDDEKEQVFAAIAKFLG